MKQYLLVFSTLLVALTSCKQSLKNKPSVKETYLYQDKPNDPVYPANIAELQFNSSGSTIFGFEYIASGKGPNPTVILVHANPGNERNLDIAQALRRAGYNVVYFDYRGSWGSEGKYSYANSIEDTRAVIDYVTDRANVQALRVDTSKIFLIGHNLGAGIGLIEGLNDKRVKAVAALSLVNPYALFHGRERELNFADLKEYFTTLKMLNCDPQTYLMEIVNNLEQYNVDNMIAASDKPVLVIDEQRNNDYLKKYNTKKKDFNYEVWDTDLEFSNHRIALTRRLKNWLDKASHK